MEPERSQLVVGERPALVRCGTPGEGKGVNAANPSVRTGHRAGQLTTEAEVHDVARCRAQQGGDLAGREEVSIVGALGHRRLTNYRNGTVRLVST
jgi:hypothetical protein